MYTLSYKTDDVASLRQQAGRWLRTLRENTKMTQRQLAAAVGVEYYTFISQIELGRGRVPPAQYAAFAQAYKIPLRDFVRNILRFYDPITYYALFEQQPDDVAAKNDNADDGVGDVSIADLASRIANLEALLEAKAR